MTNKDFIQWARTHFKDQLNPTQPEDLFHLDSMGRCHCDMILRSQRLGIMRQGYPLRRKRRREALGSRVYIYAVSTNKMGEMERMGWNDEGRIRRLAEHLGKTDHPEWFET